MTLRKTHILIAVAPLLWAGLAACGREERRKEAPRGAADATATVPAFMTFDGEPFDDATIAAFAASVPSIRGANADRELAWALAHCDCLPGAVAALAERQALRRGTLPQILVPEIRDEIRRDERLQTLTALPPLLGNLVSGLFASDDRIASDVRAKTAEKLGAALPGGTRLGERLAFRFDLFAPLGDAADGRSFAIADRAAFWTLVTSRPSLWEGDRPLALGDHGLQLLHTAIMLAEWKYLFGLDGGGLVVRAQDGVAGRPGALDPRREKNVAAFASGVYEVSYPQDGTLLDLAVNARESWRRRADAVPLGEQAMMLTAAAQAFKRLRPEARRPIARLFAAGGLLPQEVHELPLAFLATLGPLLRAHFIDAEARTVHGTATLDGSTSDPARPRDLARLARALGAWVHELTDLSGAIADEAKRTELADARAGLLDALRLVVQVLLRDHVALRDGWLALAAGDTTLPLAEAAEVIASLATVAGTVDSPLLRERIAGLSHWLMAVPLATAPPDLDASTLLWSLSALKAVSGALPESESPAWLADANARLAEAVAATDDGGSTP